MCVVLDEGHVNQWHGSITKSVHFGDSDWDGVPTHPWCQLEAQAGEHDVLHVLHAGEMFIVFLTCCPITHERLMQLQK